MKLTSEDVLNRMKFSSDKERAEAKEQLELRGVFQYNRIVDLLVDNSLEPSYAKVSALYRYDKRLRFNLYKYISYLEEGIRSKIGNYFDSSCDSIELIEKMKKKLAEYSCVSEYIETLDFGGLEKVIKKNKYVFSEIYNIDDENFIDNIEAIKVLRDKLSHHQFLLLCPLNYIDKYENNSLKSNLLNLRNYLGKNYRSGFTNCINKCSEGLDIPNQFKIEI